MLRTSIEITPANQSPPVQDKKRKEENKRDVNVAPQGSFLVIVVRRADSARFDQQAEPSLQSIPPIEIVNADFSQSRCAMLPLRSDDAVRHNLSATNVSFRIRIVIFDTRRFIISASRRHILDALQIDLANALGRACKQSRGSVGNESW